MRTNESLLESSYNTTYDADDKKENNSSIKYKAHEF